MKKILIIGAGFLQSFVIKKAKSMGYETLTVDADSNAIGFEFADKHENINIVDKKACLEYAKKECVDGVLTAATDYGVLTAAYVAKELRLNGLDYDVAKIIKNKYLVHRQLVEKQVDDTEQAFEINENTDINLLEGNISFPVMVKPCDGSGSRGATRVDDAEQLRDACKYAIAESITHRAVVEKFITGREYGAESIVINSEIYVLGIMRKWMTAPPYYAELGHAMPTDLPQEVELRAKKCVENAIRALGINFGAVNMDLIITDEGKIHIIDVGARMGGNMIGPCIIPYGTGLDYMAGLIQSVVGDKVELISHEKKAVATRLLAFSSGIVKQLPDFKKIEEIYGVEIYHHLEVGQEIKEYHTNLDGCGYIVAKADNVEVAIKRAQRVLDLINKEIFK